MTSIKNILFLFAILVSSTITSARHPDGPRSNSTGPSEHQPNGPRSNSARPSEHHPNGPRSNSTGPWAHHPDDSRSNESTDVAPHNGEGSDEQPSTPSSASEEFDYFAGSRQKRQARKVINCDYSKQRGNKCIACHKVRTCYPMNKGTEYTCSGAFQYCNNGQCSRTKGALCTSTSSSSTSTSTTGSTSSTGSTSTSSSTSSSSSSSSSTSTSTSSSSTSTSTSTTEAPGN